MFMGMCAYVTQNLKININNTENCGSALVPEVRLDYVKSEQNYVGIIRSGRQLILLAILIVSGKTTNVWPGNQHASAAACNWIAERKGLSKSSPYKYLPDANTFASER